ncbi:hypothetical protein BaRGS_00027553, partial [Batillaria attramentaria]
MDTKQFRPASETGPAAFNAAESSKIPAGAAIVSYQPVAIVEGDSEEEPGRPARPSASAIAAVGAYYDCTPEHSMRLVPAAPG